MTMWTSDELIRIGDADKLSIAPRRRDGTMRKSVPIWVVRHGDNLYVRSAYGRDAGWYRSAMARREGRIAAGGIEKDVAFDDADPSVNDQVDAAYRDKYRRYSAQYVNAVVTTEARSTTIRLVPR